MDNKAVYTHGHDEAVLRSHRARTVDNSAAYLVPHLRAGLTVLDVGCGPGTITAGLAERVAPGTVTAVDSAPVAVEVTARLASERRLANVQVALADVQALQYDDQTFDVVHAHQLLQHVPDPVLALQEMRRVCKPGGVVAARDADYQAMTWHPEVAAMEEWRALYRRVARFNGGEPDAGRRLLGWARAAGFTDIVCSASAWCFAEASERALWSETWSARVRSAELTEHALAVGWVTSDQVDAMSEAWRAWGTVQDGWFAVLHGEILCYP
jgi:SAM-dependent methyltransferase